ncbi:hypothetical protein F5Y16DRAFT_336329 [Xylariaceae sp. FL0255]|nr:hypothetical protein F5Y16DRAFT_336329 [Xylariaceae sp. FL0255]
MPEKLREKAAKKLNGPDANPSQLGDPISLKAEASDNVPTDDAKGAGSSSSNTPSSDSSSSPPPARSPDGGKDETLREKASKKLHGPEANPSQLGDPISLKNETSDGVPVDRESGAQSEKVVQRDSKL